MILIGIQPVDLTSVDEAHIGSGGQETSHILLEERAASTIGFDRVWGGRLPHAKVIPLHVCGSQWDGSVLSECLIDCLIVRPQHRSTFFPYTTLFLYLGSGETDGARHGSN